MNIVSRILELLDSKQKRNFCLLFVFVFVSAFFEMIGVASIMPFIAVASNVDVIQENYLLSTIYDYFNFTSTIGFLIFMGSAVLFLLTFSVICVNICSFKGTGFSNSVPSFLCRHYRHYRQF